MHKHWFYITAVELTATGGQTTHILEVCRALARRRTATLLAPVPPPQPVPGLTVHPVSIPAHPPREILFQGKVAHTIMRMARHTRPDVLYARAASWNMGVLLAARRLNIPAVFEVNGIRAFEYRMKHPGVEGHARYIFYTLVERMEQRLASGIVVVTPQLAEIARRNGARQVYQTMNGVDPTRFVPIDKVESRRIYGLPEHAEVVGFSGSFTPWQGLDTLIRAAVLLLPHRPTLHLLLVGDGAELPHLQTLAAPISKQVRFTGRLPHDKVCQALSACDVLAAPFAPIERNWRMGISALKLGEYMALARPILGSHLPGMEFVEQHAIGALFKPGDPADLATHLTGLLDMPAAERGAMEARARATAEQRYSWERITDDLIAFVEKL
jgi:glycosyltransferase involved in cell wall biosynthesis